MKFTDLAPRLAALLAACFVVSCLPEADEPYMGDGPMLSGTYQLDQIEFYEDGCDGESFTESFDGYVRLQREESQGDEIIAWYDCSTQDTCELTYQRDQSFYEPRPESWKRVSLWAVQGVGECILRNETAIARLDGDTLTVDARQYRQTVRGSGAQNCTRSRAASIASSTNCAVREVLTATYVGDTN